LILPFLCLTMNCASPCSRLVMGWPSRLLKKCRIAPFLHSGKSRNEGFWGFLDPGFRQGDIGRGFFNGLLDIEVEFELVGVRPHPHRVHFAQGFIFNPGLDHVFGEDIAFEQEFVVVFECFQGFIQ
jgi:hypothetical protein